MTEDITWTWQFRVGDSIYQGPLFHEKEDAVNSALRCLEDYKCLDGADVGLIERRTQTRTYLHPIEVTVAEDL